MTVAIKKGNKVVHISKAGTHTASPSMKLMGGAIKKPMKLMDAEKPINKELSDYLYSYDNVDFFLLPLDKDNLCHLNNQEREDYYAKYDNLGLDKNKFIDKGIGLDCRKSGIVGVDIDCNDAVAFLRAFLPETAMHYHEDARPVSWMLFRLEGQGGTNFSFKDYRGEDNSPKTTGELGGIKFNATTPLVPTIHRKSQKPLQWVKGHGLESLATISVDRLTKAVCHAFAFVLIARRWPKIGSRHNAYLSLAGALAYAGWSEEEAKIAVRVLVEITNDPEMDDRLTCVDTSYNSIQNGKNITGLTTLIEQLSTSSDGERDYLKRHLKDWLQGSHKPDKFLEKTTSYTNPTNTDVGNSERLVKRHGHKMRYSHPHKKWLIWNNSCWSWDTNGYVMNLAIETAKSIADETKTVSLYQSQDFLRWSARSLASERLIAMLILAQTQLSVAPEELNANPWLLNVKNRTIDLKTGLIKTPDPADLITKSAPVIYNPNAVSSEWLSFLNKIFNGDQELIRFLQRAIGYSVTSSTKEQVMFICHGIGCNGKSTLLETISHLLGIDFAMEAPPELLMQRQQSQHPTELASLDGKRMVIASESGLGKALNEERVKSLTGSDSITARVMRGDFYTFEPTHKLWMQTNHRPNIKGTDYGIWRRIKLIPFNVKITEQEKDADLPTRLRSAESLSGILNWVLEGVRLWQDEGLGEAQAVSEATNEYQTTMDIIGNWIADCCVLNPNKFEAASDLYDSYANWCKDSGMPSENKIIFGSRLKDKGLSEKKFI